VQALCITETALVVRCGYQNISKGLRRLTEVCAGDFSRAGSMLSALPLALSIDAEEVRAAVEATDLMRHREDEEQYRRSFRPHAIIETEKSRPEPLFVAFLMDVESILRIDFIEGSPPTSYPRQAVEAILKRLESNSSLPAFGRPTGFVVNYWPERAMKFSIEGKPVLMLDRAFRVGKSLLRSRTSSISKQLFSEIS
jgi:hypothetical protein